MAKSCGRNATIKLLVDGEWVTVGVLDAASTAPPPIGVMPFWLWSDIHPSPALAELLGRYAAVVAAIARYRAASLPVNPAWLREIGF